MEIWKKMWVGVFFWTQCRNSQLFELLWASKTHCIAVDKRISHCDELIKCVVVCGWLEQTMTTEDAKMFVDEALTMTKFDHRHVLHIVGISFDANSFPMVVLPFMTHGDLLSYIRDEHNVSDLLCDSRDNCRRMWMKLCLSSSDIMHDETKEFSELT